MTNPRRAFRRLPKKQREKFIQAFIHSLRRVRAENARIEQQETTPADDGLSELDRFFARLPKDI
jgi:hypothetical protein